MRPRPAFRPARLWLRLGGSIAPGEAAAGGGNPGAELVEQQGRVFDPHGQPEEGLGYAQRGTLCFGQPRWELEAGCEIVVLTSPSVGAKAIPPSARIRALACARPPGTVKLTMLPGLVPSRARASARSG